LKSLICSDIHDHIINLENALKVAEISLCDSVICCGDLCSPFIIDIFHNSFNKPVHIIFGNNDGDKFHISEKTYAANKKRKKNTEIYLHGDIFLKQKGEQISGLPEGVSLGITHYPVIAKELAATGNYECVFYGHTHKVSMEQLELYKLINPGSLMGYIPGTGSKQVKPTCIVFNWDNMEADVVEV